VLRTLLKDWRASPEKNKVCRENNLLFFCTVLLTIFKIILFSMHGFLCFLKKNGHAQRVPTIYILCVSWVVKIKNQCLVRVNPWQKNLVSFWVRQYVENAPTGVRFRQSRQLTDSPTGELA
jgi:hypothetical protein